MTGMAGKTVVVTGATSGIGRQTALRLAGMGARVALVGRDARRGEAARAAIAEEVPGADIMVFTADLAAMAETRRLAGELLGALPKIDVLINNAGAMFSRRVVTADGLERTFALNHMGGFLLTSLLRERLVASAPSRVVVVASEAHRRAQLDLADLQTRNRYSGWIAYCRSKLANILFTRELARQLAGTGVGAHCLHPGFVASGFGDNADGPFGLVFGAAKRLLAISVEQGADTPVYVASADGMVSGGYYVKSAPVEPAAAALDDDAAASLWQATTRLAGLQ
jgi:NAD(P)-dependent dehydrogenase (short-subunit alcohol dehydrogenase family)